MINLTKASKPVKVFEGIIHINHTKGNDNVTNKNILSSQQWNTDDVMKWVGFNKKEIAIRYELDHFLKTNEDRVNFINSFEQQEIYLDKRALPLKVMELAKQIGSRYYTYSDLTHLEQMNIKDALQCLFLEPFTQSMVELFYKTKLTLAQIFELKAQNPKSLFRILTLSYA
jgi:hypothetical protein